MAWTFPHLPADRVGRFPRVAFLLVVAAVVFGLAGFTLHRDRQRLRENASTSTQNIARLLDQSITGAFEKVDAVLQAAQLLDVELGADGEWQKATQDALGAHVHGLARLAPEAYAVRVTDRHGVLRFASDQMPEQRMDYSDRAFFQRLRDQPGIGRVIDGPLKGRQYNQWIIVLARPLLTRDGHFAGVIYANFRTAFFEQILSVAELGDQGAATIRTTDLALVHRFPDTKGAIGSRNVSKELLTHLQAQPMAGEYIAATALDGIERSNAYRRLRDLPFYVLVGTATLDDAADLALEGAVLFLLAGLAMLLAGVVVHVNARNERRMRAEIGSHMNTNAALQREVGERTRAELQAQAALQYSKSLLASSLDPLIAINREGLITDANPAFETLTGLARDHTLGLAYALVCADPDAARAALDQAYQQGQVVNIELDTRDSAGEVKHTLFSANVFRTPHGDVAGLVATLRDTTEQRRADRYMRVAAAAFEAQEGMIVTDAHQVILRVNQAFTAITGYSAEDAVGQTPRLFRSGHHDAEFYAGMYRALEQHDAWQGEIWNRRKNGEIYPQWLTITAVRDAAGRLDNYVSTLSDITFRKEAEDKIKALAYYDALTGLANRRTLIDRLSQALASSQRTGQHGAVLFIDLDNFKTINDTLGHDFGDLLLKQVATRVAGEVRASDTVARLGGDEFVVMLSDLSDKADTAASYAKTVGAKLLAAIGTPYTVKASECHTTPSIGITLFHDHRHSVDEILRQADLAMYQAKGGGRNGLRFFDAAMDAEVAYRAALENDLRAAIEGHQMALHFQPQVNASGALVGAEALVRWQHPQRGLVSPAAFIPMAEESGLILPLGNWVIRAACKQLAAWSTTPGLSDLTVAVNISARQIQQPDFVDQVRAAIHASRIRPRCLKLELTESVLISDIDGIAAKMVALQADGIRFALDDFGTGFSSLSYLKRLPLDQLKIDSSFVRDILVDPSDEAIAKLVISLATSLGLDVIAEGVETPAQRDMLAALGCLSYQGYLFGRPCDAPSFERLVGTALAPAT
ncbi:bifunctional diguanylate cyclase/phosphodiesterase [Hydrogenophaga sp. OTU3427]|uniref:bifunctional diguanylate cyclase/phosphodiesterase n=1 Tax=Hydrogenophaga sp. OTU3427 TaxID=3043856 RepID=UPI00313D2105